MTQPIKLMGEWPAFSETWIKCDCGYDHMRFTGMSSTNYPKYECPKCGCKECYDPKVQELNRKVDRRIRDYTR